MSYTTKFAWTCLALAVAAMAEAPKAEAADVPGLKDKVVTLYHDYAWVVLVGDQWHGEDLSSASKSTLGKYFSSGLADLLDKDNSCRKKQGLCNLDFDPIYGSQDPAAYEMKISADKNNSNVFVSFKYPSNGEKLSLRYAMKKEAGDWKVDDICYKDGTCLRKILSAGG